MGEVSPQDKSASTSPKNKSASASPEAATGLEPLPAIDDVLEADVRSVQGWRDRQEADR